MRQITVMCVLVAASGGMIGWRSQQPSPPRSPSASPTAASPAAPSASPSPADIAKVDPADRAAVQKLLLVIADSYKQYDRVSDRTNWSPLDCRVNPPAGVQESVSKDSATHGRKLYYVYAADAKSYDQMSNLTMPGSTPPSKPWMNPVGQIVVKEAFRPVEVDPKDVPKPNADTFGHKPELPPEYERIGDKVFKAGDPAGLFVMVKLDPARTGTDGGWIYGTVSADRKTVKFDGASGACYECHKETTRDRLYGHKRYWPAGKDGQKAPPTVDAKPPSKPTDTPPS
ncbi:MAG: hypothetical protein ACREJO_08875 [Phycisphaerales bacterium]